MQIHFRYEGENHVVNSGSLVLRDMISQVPENGFPFEATIVEKANDRQEFE